MKVNLYDLMDAYEDVSVEIEPESPVSVQRVQKLTMKKIQTQQSRHPRTGRLLLIAAVIVLCLGTTTLAATTGLFDSLERYLYNTLSWRFGVSPEDPRNGFDFVAEVSCGTGLNVSMNNGDIALITKDGSPWSLEQGQTVNISVQIRTGGRRVANDPGYGINVSYVRVGADGTLLDTQDICTPQIFDSTEAVFEVPETGDYYFYFIHMSSDSYILDTFTVTPQTVP